MSSPPSSSVVHRAIDLRQLPWTRPFTLAYSYDFPSVAPFFVADPARPEAWREAIARVSSADRDRRAIVTVLERQLEERRAPSEARLAAARLSDSRAVAVVSGQQAGLFGGPLYTLLKAITAIQFARQISDTYARPTSAVFWVAGEDHDWQEIRTAHFLDSDFARREVTLPDLNGAGLRPVDSLILDGQVEAALQALETGLAGTEFKGDILERLRRHYRPGVSMARAFACWLDDLLGAHGLVVFEGSDAAAKPIVADLFAREMADPATSPSLVQAACRDLRSRGFDPQVEPPADGTTLFYLDGSGRHAIKRKGNGLTIAGRDRTTDEMSAEALAHPERFSPNVLLRAVVQDRLFPTICYIGGPAEIAYQAELGGIYRVHGIERPLLCPRGTATIIDSAAAKFLDRPDIAFASLQAQNETLLNQLLAADIPPGIDLSLEEVATAIRRQLDQVHEAVPAVDPTLAGAADTTRDRMLDLLKQLQGKIIQAAKRKNDTLRRQFLRTQALVFPGGHPQERELCVAFFVSRHGRGLIDRLIEGLPHAESNHYIVLG